MPEEVAVLKMEAVDPDAPYEGDLVNYKTIDCVVLKHNLEQHTLRLADPHNHDDIWFTNVKDTEVVLL